MTRVLTTAALTLLLSAAQAAGQAPSPSPGDARWQPWLGCWQLADESVRDKWDVSAEAAVKDRAEAPARTTSRARVCVTPAPQTSGVVVTTFIGDREALQESIVADNVSRPFTDEKCRGTKRSEWSPTGRRVYTHADISCPDQPARKLSGLTMMTRAMWVDVQLIDVAGSKHIRVRRYERVPEEAAATIAPALGEASWSIADVKEASSKLEPEAVQAALVELRSGFNIKSKQLAELADANVPASVIDLMVALSYPKRFVVQYPVSAPSLLPGGYYGNLFSPFFATVDEMWWLSYYSPFDIRYWGYYDPRFLGYAGYVPLDGYYPEYPGGRIVNGGGAGGGGATPAPSGDARVVNGRGYTRITPRDPEPFRGVGGGGSNGTMSSGGSSTSGNSGTAGVSTGGYSGGGSGGGDGGRTAVPRPPGK